MSIRNERPETMKKPGVKLGAGRARRYAIYARCSTDEQAEGEFTTLDAQQAITTRHVQSLGGQVVAAFSDGGKTGTNLKRPGWAALLVEAQAGAFDAVCITYLSRLARGDAATVAEYLLKEAGVAVVSVHEQYADDEAGFVGKSVSKLVDGMYVHQVRKHTTAKMREMFGLGFVCGHVPFGYAKEKTSEEEGAPQRAVPSSEDAALVQSAFALYLETGRARDVRDFLHTATGRAWTTTQTTRLLGDERYAGVALFGSWRKEDAHPALITRETWEAAKAALSRYAACGLGPHQSSYTYYLRERVFCLSCGCAFTYAGANGRKGKVHYYVCQSVNRQGRASTCPSRRVGADRLHLSVLHRLRHLAGHPTALHRIIAEGGGWGTADEAQKAMRGQLAKRKQYLDMQAGNYLKAIGEGRGGAYLLDALDKVQAQQEEVSAQLAEAEQAVEEATVQRPTAARLATAWAQLTEVWKVLSEEERAKVLSSVVQRVEVTGKDMAMVDFAAGLADVFGDREAAGNEAKENAPASVKPPLTFSQRTVQAGAIDGSGGRT